MILNKAKDNHEKHEKTRIKEKILERVMTMFDDVLIEYTGGKKAPVFFNDAGEKIVFLENDEFGGKKVQRVPHEIASMLLKYPRLYRKFADGGTKGDTHKDHEEHKEKGKAEADAEEKQTDVGGQRKAGAKRGRRK